MSGSNAASVYGRLEEKMVARHPHLFAAESAAAGEPQGGGASEDESVLAGLATGLDELTKGFRIQERVAGVGFDWEDYRGRSKRSQRSWERWATPSRARRRTASRRRSGTFSSPL